ncbi:MAG: SH3 domain-containing protein [Clostridia bacterium]|nr:SH3 domain-containing protein [Clostridia bacterium]
MNRNRVRSITALVLALCVLCSASVSFALVSNTERQSIAKKICGYAVGQWVLAVNDGIVRDQPDGNATYIGKLTSGMFYEILDYAVASETDNIWYKVEYAYDCYGWTAAFQFATEELSSSSTAQNYFKQGDYVSHKNLSNTERQSYAKRIGERAVGQWAYALSDGRVREQPDENAAYIGKITEGYYYRILNYAVASLTNNIWYWVEYADYTFGWVAAFAFATEDLTW